MKPAFESICVVGLGYVGLPTAAILSSRGVQVLGVDTNVHTVATINQGKTHIVEPDLDMVVNAAVTVGGLKAADQPTPADAFIIAVPTPFGENHRPDLTFLRTATAAIAPVLRPGNLVILESTVPVGTTDQMASWLAEARPDLCLPDRSNPDGVVDVHVAHCPERVLPGQVLLELVRNDRVVGGITPACAARAASLYSLFVEGTCHVTSARTAELVKLSENAFRDVNIAFANELSEVCDVVDVDVWDVIEFANRHPRVSILKPGPGVGGHCIAVDPWFIVDSAPNSTPLIQAARGVNDSRPRSIAARALATARDLIKPKVACLGLSYKANIDDVRESPAVDVVAALADNWPPEGEILVVEPHLTALPADLLGLPRLRLTTLDEALEADIIILLVDHRAFANIDSNQFADRTLIDTRGFWR